jgi:hypothetical protein
VKKALCWWSIAVDGTRQKLEYQNEDISMVTWYYTKCISAGYAAIKYTRLKGLLAGTDVYLLTDETTNILEPKGQDEQGKWNDA